MTVEPEFKPWGKTPRYKGLGVSITEKLDGTNALVHITAEGTLWAGSRNRWLQPGKGSDNYGFAGWCHDNQDELLKLGAGYHYGEWWGAGIGPRKYGIEDKRLSLFNTLRWGAHNPNTPACVSAVPVLYSGKFTGVEHEACMARLREQGSVAAPGFMNPEGLILYFFGSDTREKYLLEHHDKHKFQVV